MLLLPSRVSQVVRHFLEDYKRHSRYLGFGDGGFTWQKLENKFCRQALGLKEKHEGILVKKVCPYRAEEDGSQPKPTVRMEILCAVLRSGFVCTYRGVYGLFYLYMFACMYVIWLP